MKKEILIICNDETIFINLQQEWLKDGILTYRTSDFAEAARKLSQENIFLLIIIFLAAKESFSSLEIIRKMTKIPILLLIQQYSSSKKVSAIEAGADECIAWSEDYVIETIASGRALIRRYTELNQEDMLPLNIISRGNLFMSMGYRTAFVNAQELVLSKREFELLYFLASAPGHVFTNEQLYYEVWGENYLKGADNGLHSCLNRIRRKLEEIPDSFCCIENMRGVGYRFVQNDT